ncbi:DUF4249 domain-containing protein [Polaribacter sp. ALD11]|uniref:DUF4249 family protein n=1 Tax=Polaribacter sp. ALD11 TaxID=2058137 RepID=UPI000C3127FD|nr:DUF4249 family protein [Polaribacter sp. ALD11]AUC86576.1 DUF4249 domain-containing protein [Polaribacter sp. ALD11]
MKKIYIFPFIILLFFANCEKIVEVDLPTIEPKLVIDASFEVLFDETPATANTVVKLRLSADYFEEEIPVVTNAIVFLTNLSDNAVINFVDGDLDGNYKPINTFIPEDDIIYQLTVIHNNETYKGKATKVKSTKIDNIQQGDDTLFSEDQIELKISFTDNIAVENYYLFNIDTYNYVIIEDRYFNGSEYNFSYYYEDENIEFPKNITIKLFGITKEYYTYFRVLINQSGTNGGGPFQSAPSSLLGNITNTTNESNFPLGYFHISETDTYDIDLIDKK